jgi:hemerythrin-like metal-binding protein
VKQLTLQSEELNREHKAILEKLNGLLYALNSGDPTRITMAGSVMYAEARAHVAKEEEMMLTADYPDRTAHIEQHDELMRRLDRIRNVLTFGIASWSPANELSMLERWFVPHLTYADQAFADFIAVRRDPPDTA